MGRVLREYQQVETAAAAAVFVLGHPTFGLADVWFQNVEYLKVTYSVVYKTFFSCSPPNNFALCVHARNDP